MNKYTIIFFHKDEHRFVHVLALSSFDAVRRFANENKDEDLCIVSVSPFVERLSMICCDVKDMAF